MRAFGGALIARWCRIEYGLALSLLLMPAAAMTAQAPARFSIAATAGRGVGYTSGNYKVHKGDGLAGDVMIAARLRPMAGGRLIVGVSASAQGTGGRDMSCQPTPTGGCVEGFPSFYSFAPLIGWESTGARLRTMVGPAYLVSLDDGDGDGRALGVQARFDAAIVTIGHLAVMASVRPTLVPSFRGDPVGLLAFGLGLGLR